MKLQEIFQRIQTLYSKGLQSDDSRLSERYIYNQLISSRAYLISQEANKKQYLSPSVYQTLSCIELIKVSNNECPCLPINGCEILKSKYKIPTILTNLNGSLIKTISTVDRNQVIDLISINQTRTISGNRYSKDILKCFIEGDYLYIVSNLKIKVVSMVAIFNDPIKAYSFINNCNDCQDCQDCTNIFELEFPFEEDKITPLIDIVTKELSYFLQNREDKTNNTSDNLKEESK